MSKQVEILDADQDGIQSIGQAATSVVHRAEQAMTGRQESRAITPMDMLDRAVSTGASIETLEKLMALHERYEANQARKAFDEAMAAAKAEIPTIRKNRTVDFSSQKGRTHYKHEDLAEVSATVNPILGKYGLSYRFRTTSAPNEPITVTCIVSHRLGYSEENTLVGPRDDSGNKNALQQVGSTLTYLQRMTLKAALGLAASDDDDGRAAGGSDETVTDDQIATLSKMIAETGTDPARFCGYFKIGSIDDLPASQYHRAVQSLERKKGAA